MRYKTKKSKQKKQKVYFMPESIEYAHVNAKKQIHTKNKKSYRILEQWLSTFSVLVHTFKLLENLYTPAMY